MNFNDMVLDHQQRISKLEAEVERLRSEAAGRPEGQNETGPSRADDGFEGVKVPENLKSTLKDKLPEEVDELGEAIAKYNSARGRHELNVAWRAVLDELADVANCATAASDDSALQNAIHRVVSECNANESLLRKSLSTLTEAKRDAVDLRPHKEEDHDEPDDDTGEGELA